MLRLATSLLAALLLSSAALAAQPNKCSGTATNSASTVSFPGSGATGPSSAQQYVTIINPSASDTLWVNVEPGGTAAANTAGSAPLAPVGGYVTWAVPGYGPPARVSIISSGASTPYTCWYQ